MSPFNPPDLVYVFIALYCFPSWKTLCFLFLSTCVTLLFGSKHTHLKFKSWHSRENMCVHTSGTESPYLVCLSVQLQSVETSVGIHYIQYFVTTGAHTQPRDSALLQRSLLLYSYQPGIGTSLDAHLLMNG